MGYKRRTYYKGKRVSKGEKAVIKALNKNNIIFESEKTFTNCRSPKNRPLRFDFYLPEHKLLIEYQGQHHYKPVNKYRRAKIVHTKTKIHDGIKRQYARNNNIKLLAIHYDDFENVEQIITTLLYGDSNGQEKDVSSIG
jgi:hypothetical protein